MMPMRIDVAGSAAAPGNDLLLVNAAMRCLDVLEFELFRRAWQFCHGCEPDDRQIEPGFVHYLFTHQAPGYVRHFAWRTLGEAAAEWSAPTPPPPPVSDVRGEVVLSTSIFLAAVMLLAIV